MDTALLTSSNTNSLSVLHITDRVRLRVFQCDECNLEISLCISRNVLIVSWYVLEEVVTRQVNLIATLLKCNTKHLLAFDGCRGIIWIHLDDAISAIALSTKNLQCLWCIIRSNDTITHLTLDKSSCSLITSVRERDEITK